MLQRTGNQIDMLWIAVAFNLPLKSFYFNFGLRDFSLIIHLIPIIFIAFFYINNWTYTFQQYYVPKPPLRNYIGKIWVLELSSAEKTIAFFWPVIWIAAQMYLFSVGPCIFCFISLIVLCYYWFIGIYAHLNIKNETCVQY